MAALIAEGEECFVEPECTTRVGWNNACGIAP
jgi:hypothetical protein